MVGSRQSMGRVGSPDLESSCLLPLAMAATEFYYVSWWRQGSYTSIPPLSNDEEL